jgi:ATP-dependent RNA helicase RhlB
MEFTDLELHPDLKKSIEEAGFKTCMPVQAQVFPYAFKGEDIYAQSQTGTGKTAAFLVSIMQRIMTESEQRTRKALILTPTRELAVQIYEDTQKLGKYLPIKAGAFYGGVGYGPQIDMLKDDVQIIIGTPGRIIDLLQQGKMLLKEVGFLVIDEADRMFDMGFIDDLRKLLRYLPTAEKRQTYLFSATLSERVRHLAWEYMHDPKEIVIEPESKTVDLVTQEVHHVASNEKFRLLLGILKRDKPASAIIFCNQKYMVEEVSRRLNINGINCDFIMGDLPQNKRLEIIQRMKSGALSILVATDVAARGLDIDALDMVINYDVPVDTESYVHRIGRTARAGKSGKAVTLACEKFVYGLPAIEEYINMKIPVAPFDESLLEEDKSAGMHFGHGRDRSRESPGHRGGREPRREPHRDARPGLRSGDRRPAPRPAPVPQSLSKNDARPAPRKTAPSTEADLYNMPLEERMRLYKKKYGGQQDRAPAGQDASRGPGRGGQKRPAGQDASRSINRRGQEKRPSGGTERAPAQKRPGDELGKRRDPRAVNSRPVSGKPQVAQASAAKKAGATQGVRGFLAKLFKKSN